MKKILYTIFVALLFAVGCEVENTYTPDVAFYFGKVTTETTESTAAVMVTAYMTVDEELYSDANVYLEYWKRGDDANVAVATDSADGDSQFIRLFTINDLEPDTQYMVNVVIDGGAEYGSKSELFTFATKQKHIPVESITCDASVAAKGLKATVNLSNVAYLVDDEAHQIAFLKLEYSRAGLDSWRAVEVAGSSIKSGKVSIDIPKSGDSYLAENSDYTYHVTITPSNSDFKAITTEDFSFKTTYAEVTASVAKPQLSYSTEGITIKVGAISVSLDGVATTDYTTHIYFRAQGTNLWEEYAPSANSGVLIPASVLKDNTTYEAKVSIVAGAQCQVRESQVATITTPKNETPITPEPPVGGDTASVAGVWHLTSWRGATPSFEVYMDITSTGGVTLYQRIDSLYWDVFQSTAAIANGVISGVYTDNVAWGASYNVLVAGDTMTWTATNDSSDVSIYTRSTLPASMPTAPTRTATTLERFL